MLTKWTCEKSLERSSRLKDRHCTRIVFIFPLACGGPGKRGRGEREGERGGGGGERGEVRMGRGCRITMRGIQVSSDLFSS